ncbi:MAG TPA: hypothetical protein VFH04_01950 [Nitrososphaeraceae archaeon]|jgi:hypothetical protein|nr:hypothetical protein [Nitrososphaeraceae archaeon]
MKNNNGVRKDVIQNEEDLIPSEKWLVAFRTRNIDPYYQKISIREFLSPGFYEAFDRVASFAEKTNVEILWFKEKRMCHGSLLNSIQISLEWFCTYCNLESNIQDSIPCNELSCTANLCSRTCYEEHMQLKHRGSVTD